MAHTEEKGSQIAKDGFRNEYFVIDTFNAWQNHSLAQKWLMAMDYRIDKRWLKTYQELWNIPDDIYQTLQYYVGEIKPYKNNTKDKRRMFMNEIEEQQQKKLIEWLKKIKR